MTSKLAHTLYGEPVSGQRPAQAVPGSSPAPASAPYEGRNRCVANNDTCNGPRAKGTDYCAGHLRSMTKGKEVS